MLLLLPNNIIYAKSAELIESFKSKHLQHDQASAEIDLLNKSAYEQHTNMPDVAFEISKATLELSKTIGHKNGQANSLFNIGLAHFVKGEYHEAIDSLIKSLYIFKSANNLTGEAKAVHSIANTYNGLGNYQLALKYLFRSLEISQNFEDDKEQLAKIYGSIGTTFSRLNNFEDSLKYHEKALELRREIDDKKHIAYCLTNIGAIYQHLNNLEQAKDYYGKAMEIGETLENSDYLMGTIHINLGQVFLSEDDYENALDNLFKALDIRLGIDSVKGIANCNICIGKVYLKQGTFEEAIKYIEQATIMYESIDAKGDLVDCYESLSYCFEGLNQFNKALIFARKSSNLNNELFSEERAKTIAELQTKHNFKAKEKEIARLNKEQHLLKSRNEELKRFASIVSHDLREPMRTIISFTQQLEKKFDSNLDEAGKEFMNFIIDASSRMINMLHDLKNYALSGVDEGFYEECDLNEILIIVQNNLQVRLEEKNASINIQSGFPKVLGSKTKLIQLFQNLAANGIKFQKTDIKPNIEIGFTKTATKYTFFVADNGIGMAKENTKHIFEMFKRLHTNKEYEGTGTGLAVCKQIAELLGGRIYVTSELGKGSTFYVEVPVTSIVE